MDDSIRPAFLRLLMLLIIVYTLALGIGLFATDSAVRSRNKEIAQLIAVAAEPSIALGDFRETIQILSRMGGGAFEHITFSSSDQKTTFSIPPHLDDASIFQRFFRSTIYIEFRASNSSAELLGRASFSYSRARSIGVSFLIWCLLLGLIIPILSAFKQKMIIRQHRELTTQTESARADIARQVSHDIRSPLSALNMIVSSLKELPEEKRLIIRNATQRINDIANDLLRHSNIPLANLSNDVTTVIASEPVMLVALLDTLVSEKRIQFRERMEIEIQDDLSQGYGLFAKINSTEFSRAISNLVNNSVEALSGPGRVTISIRGSKNQIAVIVSDNGSGIPAEILARIGERGFSHGKDGRTQSGSGLGVYHARQTVEHAGGRLSIQSQIGVGTFVSLMIPRAETPRWFVKKITLPSGSLIVSVDDDQTIHQIFAGRLASAGASSAGTKHLMFSSLGQLETWTASNWPSESHFLIDYEFLGQTENGLDLIERAGIGERAILVTSRYEEPHIRSRAEALGVRILPKTLAPFVPLTIENPRERFDAILIDDDSLVHMTWQMAANEKGRRLLCFSTPEEFWARASEIAFSSPIYVDVNLGTGMQGEEAAGKIIAQGFTEVFLATGYAPNSIDIPYGIRGVVGKDPVF